MDPGPEHVDNAIHGVMNVQIERRGAPLRAKALALQLDDTAGLLVILDLVLLLTGHCDHLRRRLARATGVAAGSIVVHCTHSHSTPFAEPLDGPHPFFDLVCERAEQAAAAAVRALQPARVGFGQTFAAGASFNQRLPLPDGGVKFTRDFREGLASGRPVDPRLSVLRIDTVDGSPLAGWVCFAAHPSVVIFDAPVSAEYPGYLTGRLERTLTGGAPVLFGVGACGDVNCVPMFGSEEDSRRLGENLAALIEPAWRSIDPVVPERFGVRQGSVDLPLDPPPAPATLDREIDEIDAFLSALDDDPTLAWAMGINVEPEWPVERKRSHFTLLRDWAVDMKAALAAGRRFPTAWRSSIAVWVIDDLGLVFYGGEPFTEIALELAARSPLGETLLLPMANGSDGYVATDAERRRGGYEPYTNCRTNRLAPGLRPLPYAIGAAGALIDSALLRIHEVIRTIE